MLNNEDLYGTDHLAPKDNRILRDNLIENIIYFTIVEQIIPRNEEGFPVFITFVHAIGLTISI